MSIDLTADKRLQREFMAATTPPPSLYAIVQSFLLAMNAIDEADGEVDAQLAAQLDALPVDLGRRAEVLKGACVALDAEADACEAMAAPYRERAARKRAQRDGLKRYLFTAMQVMSIDRAAGPTGGARIQANGAAALRFTVPENDLESYLPAECFETVRVLKRDVVEELLKNAKAERMTPTQFDALAARVKELIAANKLPALADVARFVRGSHLRFF